MRKEETFSINTGKGCRKRIHKAKFTIESDSESDDVVSCPKYYIDHILFKWCLLHVSQLLLPSSIVSTHVTNVMMHSWKFVKYSIWYS